MDVNDGCERSIAWLGLVNDFMRFTLWIVERDHERNECLTVLALARAILAFCSIVQSKAGPPSVNAYGNKY